MMRFSSAALLATGMVGLAAFSGCAALQRSEARSTEQLLSAAGFKLVAADTPQRIDALRTLKPNTITTADRNGQLWYVYPDPVSCHCLYVGKPSNYQEYQRLAVESEIAETNLMAADEAAADFGMWGPWY